MMVRRHVAGQVPGRHAGPKYHTANAGVTEYTLLEANTPDKVIHDVNRMIRSGWEPLGGINVAVRERPKTEVLWSHAMVHRS